MIHSIIFGIVLFVAVGMTVFSQTIDRESNWSKETGRADDWFTHFDFRRYTMGDLSTARTRFLEIDGDKALNEWEGLFYNEQMLGRGELMWSVKSGFVMAYTYHTLASLDYGAIVRKELQMTLTSEKRSNTQTLCLVKFGNTHFLVPPNSLRSFAREAVGLSTNSRYEQQYDENKYYWVKASEQDARVFGLPVFPKEFAHLVRRPITAITEHISAPKFHKENSADGKVLWKEAQYLITINAGRNKGIKKGMSFYLDDLDERLDVIRVYGTKSLGVLERAVEANKEICTKYVRKPETRVFDQVNFPCRPVNGRLKARTLSEVFFP